MKKLSIYLMLFAFGLSYAQESANRFFYELTYKPKKDSARTESVLMSLDVAGKKSIFRDYTIVAQDSIVKAQVEQMKKTQTFKDFSKDLKQAKFSYKIVKTYPELDIQYSETILNGFSAVRLAYKENLKLDWKVLPEKQKIGEYDTQKATTTYGGRTWTAWFSTEIPFQDGPYKFNGLPGLIVKIEDDGKNYSWELKGNKKIDNFTEELYSETLMIAGGAKTMEVSREKFEKTFSDYKKDPFASFRSQIPAEAMSQKMPGQDKTIGETLREQEKKLKELYGGNDNPVELKIGK